MVVARGTINGGTVNLTEGSILSVSNTFANLNGVTINGDIVAGPSARFVVSGTTAITNIRLSGANANLQFAPGTVLSNTTITYEGAGGGTRSVGMNGTGGDRHLRQHRQRHPRAQSRRSCDARRCEHDAQQLRDHFE